MPVSPLSQRKFIDRQKVKAKHRKRNLQTGVGSKHQALSKPIKKRLSNRKSTQVYSKKTTFPQELRKIRTTVCLDDYLGSRFRVH